jgi:HD superfamily phosphohydrolase
LKPFVIRDPVHGYLRIAGHERLVVDRPITQRLRNVNQTGLAHLVYPEARTSRFAHSLGAMHLASRFFLAAVEHSSEDCRAAFFADLERELSCLHPGDPDFEALDFLLAAGGENETTLLASRLTFSRKLQTSERIKQRRIFACAEGGLRLAALFHDLGHFPFSHDLEEALRKFAKSEPNHGLPEEWVKDAPHEEVGHKLATLFFNESQSQDKGLAAVYRTANAILHREPLRGEPATSLDFLHELISGEIDVDRADYLLRDARAFGFEFAVYDLERMVDNLALSHTLVDGFFLAVLEQGLGAVETFFVARARSHQLLVRHHKVAQVAAALQLASVKALQAGPGSRLLEGLRRLAGADPSAPLDKILVDYARFDDGWWLEVLRQLQDQANEDLIDAALRLVLNREQTFCSIWKRSLQLEREQIDTINEVVDVWLVQKMAATPPLDLATAMRHLFNQGILAVPHRFKPYTLNVPGVERSESRFKVLLGSAKGRHPVPASQHSPLMRSLYPAWGADVHLHAFALAKAPPSVDEIVKLFEGFRAGREPAPRT